MNLGIFSLHVARCWRGKGSLMVLGFEPAAEVFRLAVRNLQENGVQVVEHVGDSLRLGPDHNASEGVVVHCYNAALTNHDEEEEFCYFPHLSSSSTLTKHRGERERHKQAGIYNPRL